MYSALQKTLTVNAIYHVQIKDWSKVHSPLKGLGKASLFQARRYTLCVASVKNKMPMHARVKNYLP